MQTHQRERAVAHVPPGTSRVAPGTITSPVPSKRILGQTVTPWLWGYGLFHGSAGSTDNLILCYASVGLGLSPAVVGMVDATSSAALVLGAVLLSVVLARVRNQRAAFALSMAGTG